MKLLEKDKGVSWQKEFFSIPNCLCYFRLLLLPVFVWVFFHDTPGKPNWAALFVIAVSGLSDCADGIIARRFDMITEWGKIIDPVADKLTQLTVACCLTIRFPYMGILFAVMICAGASEQSMCQWASLFAEKGLGVSKTVGDLMGPCAFAAMMGCGRVFFGTGKGGKWPVEEALAVCAALCVACYLTAALSPWPGMALAGCAVCGLSVGVMWPGTLTLASGRMPMGGTAMFALLALGGDVGCSAGPALVGLVADALSGGVAQVADESMRTGFLFALIFPVALMGGVAMIHKTNGKRKRSAAE